MRLDGETLDGETARGGHNLLELELVLGRSFALDQRRVVNRAALGLGVEHRELHEAVDLLRVAGAHRLADPLGQAAVQRRLTALKARPRAGASPRLLTAVTKAARHALPGGHAPSLPRLLLVRPGRRLQRAKRDRLQLRGRCVPDLPVEDLHVHRGARGARGYTTRGSQSTAEQTLHGQEPCHHEHHSGGLGSEEKSWRGRRR
mmetsp:Transcript_38526/g.90553  ORF Transcript_38526/g.90553 Transcript_38526/m.90553 type:complete len:203 (-) Transcript_38526:2-610(-)